MIKIFLADDHTIMRDGLREIIDDTDDLRVVGEAADGHAVLAQAQDQDWDLLLLDISMPGVSGLELIRLLKKDWPKLPILVLSMHNEEEYAARALKAGACGYLNKECGASHLLEVIRKVADGGVFVSPRVAELLARDLIPRDDALPHTTLSAREYQVFRLIVAGKAMSEIAQHLSVSIKTVSTYKLRIMQKMKISNHAGLIRYAVAHDLAEEADI